MALVVPIEPCLVCGGSTEARGNQVRCSHGCIELERDSTGMLRARGRVESVSYPEDGASRTLEIEETSFWFKHRNEVLMALLRARFRPSGTLWDIGGGNGLQARTIQTAGFEVVMVEPGQVGCSNALRRGVRHVVCGTLKELRLPSACLHAVSLLDVIEHLEDPLQLLAECARVMRPQGTLFVTVPAYPFLWSDEDVYAGHFRRYTKDLLKLQIEATGFRIEFLSHYFQALALPILLVRALPYRLRPHRSTMNAREHTPGGVLQALLGRLLERELDSIQRGRPPEFGSSLIAVAKRM